MATSTKKNTPAPAKRTAKKATPAPAKAESKPTTPAKSYRDVPEFMPALKAAKSLSKGNADLFLPLQLITHLAWKTPGGTVGWDKGTTPNVVAYSEDIAVPPGTEIPVALATALSLAEKGAADKPQKDAVAVLAKVIKAHTA